MLLLKINVICVGGSKETQILVCNSKGRRPLEEDNIKMYLKSGMGGLGLD
jgi:hypothetical protein